MARAKVLLSLDPEVLELIDRRAQRHGMTRSAFIAAAALGLVDQEPVEEQACSPVDAPRTMTLNTNRQF